jgi:proteasome lid subunit RPN8/RPN11
MSKNSAKKQQASAQIAVVSAAEVAPVAAGEPRVNIDSEVTRRIRQHARAHFKTEVCGVLIGESTDTEIDIRASIEALTATQAGTHVTFTQDAWEEIYKVKDVRYPDARIVGWYHSHPGFGIFLSEHDLFIQENFFSSPGQVAWVYDPHSDEEGCFGWVGGKVARLTSVSVAYRGGEAVEHAANHHDSPSTDEEYEDEPASTARKPSPPALPAWFRWAQLVMTHLTVLAVGFALAYFVFPRMLILFPDPATGDVMVVDYYELRAYVHGNGPMPKAVERFGLSSVGSAMGAPAASPAPATPSPNPATQPAIPSAAPPAAPGSHN